MFTSKTPSDHLQPAGLTVREAVESNPGLVNEVWCRRIFRQILHSLERQYAMQLPHRPISPDTILILDRGEPVLLPSPSIGAAWSAAGDLHDLAAVIHYAITREFPPAAPLRGRMPATFGEHSATFVTAVDRCLSPLPHQRPHHIDDLRASLGIVQLKPAAPGQVAPQAAAAPPLAWPGSSAPTSEPGRMRRWLLLAAVATVPLAALLALLALLHGSDSRDAVTLALPANINDTAATPAHDDATLMAAPRAAAAPSPDAAAGQAPAIAPAADLAPPPASGHAPPRPQLSGAKDASYKLLIKPWGMIYLDGVSHGPSPPLKRLVLAPGQHRVRIANPAFPEHNVLVTASKGGSSVIELDFNQENLP